MHKKAIEQIPWQLKEKETLSAKAAVVTIQEKEYLIVDITGVKTPLIRIAICDNDFANWYPPNTEYKKYFSNQRENSWDEKMFNNTEIEYIETYKIKKDITISKSSETIIKMFLKCNAVPSWRYSIQNKQSEIRSEKQGRANERRMERIDKRMKTVPSIPKGFYNFMKTVNTTHYIMHNPFLKEKIVVGICSHCSGENTLLREEVRKKEGQCNHCRKKVLYKRCRDNDIYRMENECILTQRTTEGFVDRHFIIYKTIRWGEEIFKPVEIVRRFLINGKEHNYYHKGGWNTDYWDDKNLYGMNNIVPHKARVYPRNLKSIIKDSEYQYSALDLVAKKELMKPTFYLLKYKEIPEVEMLAKLGLTKLAYQVGSLFPGKNPWERIGITKEQFDVLKEINGGIHERHLLMKTKKYINPSDLKWLNEMNITSDDFGMIMKYTTPTKLFNYIKKEEKQKERLTTYKDYIQMAESEGYDLTNTITLFPRDLHEEHQKVLEAHSKTKSQQKQKEANSKYKEIAKMKKELERLYGYENEIYLIRPPKNAGEIIKEGQMLHHCVGSGSYISSMSTRKTTILFLRKKEKQNRPFYTLEISEERRIILQWQGLNNKKEMEHKQVKDFLEMFKKEKLGGTANVKKHTAKAE